MEESNLQALQHKLCVIVMIGYKIVVMQKLGSALFSQLSDLLYKSHRIIGIQ